jgi:hypothetical protein
MMQLLKDLGALLFFLYAVVMAIVPGVLGFVLQPMIIGFNAGREAFEFTQDKLRHKEDRKEIVERGQ